MTGQDWQELFKGNDLEVYSGAQGTNSHLAVTFDYSSAPSRPPNIPACTFFAANGFDQIHIATPKDIWYQTPELMRAIDLIGRLRDRYERVVTYGNSMGAYGAILVSGLIKATTVIAFAPQFSADAAKVPSEKRWHEARKEIKFIHDNLLDFTSKTADIYTIYDPFYEEDVRHIDLLREVLPILEIKLPFAGHYPASSLNEVGILVSAMQAMMSGSDATRRISQLRRQERRKASLYFVHLSQALARRNNMAGAFHAANVAYGLAPDRPEVLETLLSITYQKPEHYALAHVAIRLLQSRFPSFTHYDGMRDNLMDMIKSHYRLATPAPGPNSE